MKKYTSKWIDEIIFAQYTATFALYRNQPKPLHDCLYDGKLYIVCTTFYELFNEKSVPLSAMLNCCVLDHHY